MGANVDFWKLFFWVGADTVCLQSFIWLSENNLVLRPFWGLKSKILSFRFSRHIILIVFLKLTLEVVNRCSKLNRRWAKERILAPLMFTRDELSQFANTFPLEFLDIRENNIVLFGQDPFPELFKGEPDLLHECKREIRGNILRVRQQFVEADGQPEGSGVTGWLDLDSYREFASGDVLRLGQHRVLRREVGTLRRLLPPQHVP